VAKLIHSGKKPSREDNTVLIAYRYRLYPDKEQKTFFAKTFGCVRFYWNKAVELKLKNQSSSVIRPAQLKKEYPFLREIDSMALCNAQLQLEKAFSAWLQGKAGKPAFKRKKARQSYTTNNIGSRIKVDFDQQTIKLPKLKKPVKAKLHRKFTGKIKSVTVEKTPTDKYYVSILVEVEKQTLSELARPTSRICGIDVGLIDYAVIASDNGIRHIPHPKWIKKTEKQIIKLQRRLAKKQGYRKGEKKSENFERLRKKLARLYEKLVNQRKDFLHKLSKAIISENQAVVVESLCIKNMQKNPYLAKAISDSAWSEFIRMVKYKAEWYGRIVIEAPTNFPSSKQCHVCNWKNKELKLSERTWKCPVCKIEHQRDENSSINLYLYGLACLKGGRAGLARTYACGGSSNGGTAFVQVYELSPVEAGSSTFYKVE